MKILIINIETKDSPKIISRGLSYAVERMNGMNGKKKMMMKRKRKKRRRRRRGERNSIIVSQETLLQEWKMTRSGRFRILWV